jgi:hypothetical protein
LDWTFGGGFAYNVATASGGNPNQEKNHGSEKKGS